MDTNNLLVKGQDIIANFGMKLAVAIIILLLGRWIAKGLARLTRRAMEKAKVDAMLARFIGSLIYVSLLTFVILAAINQLGVQTTSFIAVIGAAGLAVGLALQGSLANLAAGVLIILFRPYKVGDFIEGGGVAGTAEEVQIFTTVLKTPDNKTVIVPNSHIMSGTITNYSARTERRIDLVVGVSYDADLDKTRRVLTTLLDEDERILKEPAPTIGVIELADSSVNFVVRPWVKTTDYWPVYFDLNERIKKRFDAEGISIPFPQRDVHLYEHKS
ncbi:MAG: mechanosensitive ion channel [Gallionella sp.]|nr:mechanosensitive ion channel [Gallionella sp.]